MKTTLTCHIREPSKSYKIDIHDGLLTSQAPFLSTLANKFAVITTETIAFLYANALIDSLSSYGLETHLLTFPSGEEYKNRATKELLENQLFEKGLGRDTCLIGLGGGVVTDLTGYLAATYCRGIPFVTIPTTLLGMVDASIGGKTGINVPYGKNMLGCIYQPKKVVIDPSLLNSLPKKEFLNGVVETIKHGIIANPTFFEFLENESASILNLDPDKIRKMIFESCRIKKEIVEQDERENGMRRLLNFGHTIAHALETLSNYSLSHGKAVAIGMLVESYLAVQIKTLEPDILRRIYQILKLYEIPLKLPASLPENRLLNLLTLDKKALNQQPRFVIIEAIGSAKAFEGQYCTTIEMSLIKQALSWMSHDLCCH
ncbi:MAG: 3-dehydroquinate synthase [Parachlamydiaceae bacterium]